MPPKRVRFDLALVVASIDRAVRQVAAGKPGTVIVMPLDDPKAFRVVEGDVGEIEALAKLTGPAKPHESVDPAPRPPPELAPKRAPKRKPPTRRKRER